MRRKRDLDNSTPTGESGERGGVQGGDPPASALGPDMTHWSDRQVQTALYSQLFLIGLSLRETARVMVQLWRLANASNWGVNAPTPQPPSVTRQGKFNEKKPHTTQTTLDDYTEWLRHHQEADEALSAQDQGIAEGREPRNEGKGESR